MVKKIDYITMKAGASFINQDAGRKRGSYVALADLSSLCLASGYSKEKRYV